MNNLLSQLLDLQIPCADYLLLIKMKLCESISDFFLSKVIFKF